MDSIDLFKDSFDRVAEELPRLLEDLPADSLLRRAHVTGNPVAWLAWHIGRCEDAQMAALDDRTEVWDQGWRERFDLPYGPHDNGYGQTFEQVSRFQVTDADLLTGYYAAVHEQTLGVLDAERGKDLDRVIDAAWDPPVTAGARIVSVVNDVTQHLGQIAYLHGLSSVRTNAPAPTWERS
ncbi:DinB family protein [uncultured Propionibacterium sp.]|uniref:mycothiol transferase n=1 Tax=uncultured Propionibacterium sp. TaxID=218066 RepID=UPI00292F3B3B|nr:DinB family protein [uncultured Propionibacterium sp.]